TVCGVALASWMARMPAVKQTLDVSTAEIGVLLLGTALGSIAGLLASSLAIERFDAKRVMLAGVISVPAGLVVAGLGVNAVSFWAVFAGLFVLGVGLALCDVATNVSGAINERLLKRTLLPLFHAFFSIGTMVGAGAGALAELLTV